MSILTFFYFIKSCRIKLLWLFFYTVVKLLNCFVTYTLLQIKIRHTIKMERGAMGDSQPPERSDGPQTNIICTPKENNYNFKCE